MGDIINNVASEYDIPKSIFSNHFNDNLKNNKLTSIINEDKPCSTCNKEDVCMYKLELLQSIKEITQILEHTNDFITIDIKCKKWSGKEYNRF